ncbi:MAG TPA: acyl-CoA dehydrogenase family protein [Actinophytocola sp.]|jgi:alkylation response protein AidB-like acyl-CoA dehydrogenase|uniref:acyl-CoA dehydrogenase family protein n=1 Tax=Actinophytocola sp. TaxID=1872138 RepID=UPI002E052688|nr:acyl-CoA dehydrogenase family protein [Actinophytocola sp.]
MSSELLSLSTDEFIGNIGELARSHFDCKGYPQENLRADDWALLVRAGVLLPALPREYGGRDSHLEMCRVVEALAEWNLPLGMYTKIITAVALRPIALRASEETRREMLPLFAGRDPMICGFASTEPGCGSAMANMGTTFEEVDGGYRIRGRKHWQGFSSTAHWWLLSAKSDAGGQRRYGYFIVKRSEGFRTVQRYEPLGMKLLDYGLNEIDAFVPRHRRIDAEDRNLSAMVDMLMPPRSMMATIASGFLRRISREAQAYADNRVIGSEMLSDIGFARYRLKAIETSATICEALNDYVMTALNVKVDMTDVFPVAQALKTVATERMVSSAYHYQQLVGGEGYRVDSPTNIAGKAFLDTRVFTIFDGTNDLLSQQLTQFCLKRRGARSLSGFLAARCPYTGPGIVKHGLDMRFLDQELKQEHLVLGGRAIAYAFAITQLTRWAQQVGGDAVDRAREAIEFLKCDIDGIAREFALLATGVLDDDEVVPNRLAA